MCRVSKLKLDARKYMRQRPKRLHYGLKLKHKKSTAAKSTPFHVQGGKKYQAKHIKKLVTEQKLVSTQSIPKDHQNYLKFQQRLIVDETNRRNNEIVKPRHGSPEELTSWIKLATCLEMVVDALRKDIGVLAEDFGRKVATNFPVSAAEATKAFESVSLECLLAALKHENEEIDSYLKSNLSMISSEIDTKILFDETIDSLDVVDTTAIMFETEVEVKQKVLEGRFFTKKQRLKHLLYYSAMQTKQYSGKLNQENTYSFFWMFRMLSFIPSNDTFKEDKLKLGKMNFLANWPKMIENNETYLDVAQCALSMDYSGYRESYSLNYEDFSSLYYLLQSENYKKQRSFLHKCFHKLKEVRNRLYHSSKLSLSKITFKALENVIKDVVKVMINSNKDNASFRKVEENVYDILKESDVKVVFKKFEEFLSTNSTEKIQFKQQNTNVSKYIDINTKNLSECKQILESSRNVLRITTSKKRKRVVNELVETNITTSLHKRAKSEPNITLDTSSLKDSYENQGTLSKKVLLPSNKNQVKHTKKLKNKVRSEMSLIQQIKKLKLLQEKAKTKINNQRLALRQRELNLERKNNIYSNLQDKYKDLKELSCEKEQCFASIQNFHTEQIKILKNQLNFAKESMKKIIQKSHGIEKTNFIKQVITKLSKNELGRAPLSLDKNSQLSEVGFPKTPDNLAIEKVSQNKPGLQTDKSSYFTSCKKKVQHYPKKEVSLNKRKKKSFSRVFGKDCSRKKKKP